MMRAENQGQIRAELLHRWLGGRNPTALIG